MREEKRMEEGKVSGLSCHFTLTGQLFMKYRVCVRVCVCMHFGLVHVTNHSLPLLLHLGVQKAETKKTKQKKNMKGMSNKLSAKQ